MFQAIVKVFERFKQVAEKAHKAALNNLRHAAAGIRKDARAEIERSPDASQPGQPPHTRHGLLKAASTILYAVDPNAMSAVIGPVASKVGQSASAHEFGGNFKGEEYPARPFMRPAMDGRLEDFAGSFTGSIGE